MTIFKSVISTDNSCSESNMLGITRVKPLVTLEERWTHKVTSNLWNWELAKKMKNFSTITFGHHLILSSMQSIMSKLDNTLINNVSGMRSHCSKVELLVQNAIPKSSFLTIHWVTLISSILQKNPFHFAHWRTSHIKSNIQSNGQETILRESSQSHLQNCLNSTPIAIKP